MSEKIYCKDCRFCENGLCHRIPPVRVPGQNNSLFPAVKDFDWCYEADEKEEEDNSCNSESPEYQYQAQIKTLEDKIEFLKTTQRVIIRSLENDCRQLSTSGNCRMYRRGCDTNCLIHQIIMKYNIL